MTRGSGIFIRMMVAALVYSDAVTAKLRSSKSKTVAVKDEHMHIFSFEKKKRDTKQRN